MYYYLETHLTIVIGVAVVMLAAVLVLQQRRTPQSTVAWLLFFTALPYLAIPVFLALGFRKSAARIARLDAPAESAVAAPQPDLAATFSAFGLPPATGGARVSLLASGEEAHREAMAAIEGARETLDLTFYLIANDDVGRTFVEALARKAAAGVRVRLIIDYLGGLAKPRAALRALKAAGGEVRYFSPLVSLPDRGHMNLRNHRKMIVADDRLVFAGGRNIGEDYLGPGPDERARWRDLSFTVSGPVAASYAALFRSDWAGCGGRANESPAAAPDAATGGAVAQLVPSGPDTRDDPLHDGLVQAIHSARRRVWVATPYFLPTEELEHALATSARRGIDVRIIVPAKSNHRIADFARGSYLRSLMGAGCRVLRFGPGMLHAKAGVVDDAAWIGSANFDIRSMLLNFEASLFVYGGEMEEDETVRNVAAWLAALERDCAPASERVGPARRLAEGLFRLGAPLL